jgi:hypothetical protein
VGAFQGVVPSPVLPSYARLASGVKVNQARVSQSGLKTGGGVTAGGAHGIIMEVA